MMALRMVLIGLVACLGIEFSKEPAFETRSRRDVDGPVAPFEDATQFAPEVIPAPPTVDALPAASKRDDGQASRERWQARVAVLRDVCSRGIETIRDLVEQVKARQADIAAAENFKQAFKTVVRNDDEAVAPLCVDDEQFAFIVDRLTEAFAAGAKAEPTATIVGAEEAPAVPVEIVAQPEESTESEEIREIAVEMQTPETAIETVETTEQPTDEPVASPVTPVGRFANALRLTGRACEAWADLLDSRKPAELTRKSAREQTVR